MATIYKSETYIHEALDSLQTKVKAKSRFHITNIEKISINTGVGKYETKQQVEIAQYLEQLTGQKPKQVASKVSVAGFKLRKGQTVGYTVTLRGKKMQDFLLMLTYLALPRSRDFRGTKNNSFDNTNKTYSLGIPNAGIFPVIGFDTTLNFGLQVNITFTQAGIQNKQLLEELHFPLKKA
jgi:large subunit ribosomal protein L5